MGFKKVTQLDGHTNVKRKDCTFTVRSFLEKYSDERLKVIIYLIIKIVLV